jgi:hypothetical protein
VSEPYVSHADFWPASSGVHPGTCVESSQNWACITFLLTRMTVVQ